MASRIVSFKEETVAEVALIGPFLLKMEVFEDLEQLLVRAESFVRPLLDRDGSDSARKQLLKLLTLRMGIPSSGADLEREVCTLLQQMADVQIQSLLSEMDVGHKTLLSQLELERLERLRTSAACRTWIDRELVCRLGNSYQVEKLWHLLLQNGSIEGEDDWAKAAGLLLAAKTDSMDTPLKGISGSILRQASKFLENKEQAINFAQQFFNSDLGILGKSWPHKASSRLLMEMASRCGGRERIRLLVRARHICPLQVRDVLLVELRNIFLGLQAPSGRADWTFDLEDLFVDMTLEYEGKLSADVIQKLNLKEKHLQHFKGDFPSLVQQLREANRPKDASRVAVMHAQNLVNKGEIEKAEETFFSAFCLDSTNVAAASGLMDFATRVQKTAAAMKKSCQVCNKNSQLGRLMCSKGHFICFDCSPHLVRSLSFQHPRQPERHDFRHLWKWDGHRAVLRCVRWPCSSHYTDHALARALPEKIFAAYRDAQDYGTEEVLRRRKHRRLA